MAEASRESILREVRRVHRDWPTFLHDSIPAVEKAALALDDEARTSGLAMASAFVLQSRERRNKVCSFAVYLRERRWEKLADIGVEAKDAPAAFRPFSKPWMALWLSELLKPASMDRWPAPSAWQRAEMRDADKAREIERERRQRYGWPKANSMRERPRDMLVSGDLVRISERFTRLHRDSDADAVAGWKALHDRMGWPWLPLPLHEWLFFPPGEPGESMEELRSALQAADNQETRKSDDAA